MTAGNMRRRLAVVSGPLAGAGFSLRPGEHTLGRSDRADIRLDDPAVGLWHLRVGVGDDAVILTPASPRAVTYVAGRPITPRQRVAHGQVFEVGHSLLAVRPEAEPPPGGRITFQRPPPAPLPGPPLELRLPAPPPEPPPPFRRWRRRRQANRFQRQLADAASRLSAMRSREAQALHGRWPDAAELEARARLALPPLWERRPDRPDFLCLRLGWGDLPSRVRAVVPDGGRADLREEALFVAEPWRLAGVPLVVDLPVVWTLAVAGPRTVAAGLARWLIAQAAVLHSPRDLALAAFLPLHTGDDWEWLRGLPHAGATIPGVDGPLVASSPGAQRRLAAALADCGRHAAPCPALLALVHEAAPAEPDALADLLRSAGASRALVIWVGCGAGPVPAGSGAVVDIARSGMELRLRLSDAGNEVVGVPDLVGLDYADAVARALSRVHEPAAPSGGAAGRHTDSTVTQ